jgi:SAM-dependent methyltransferase
MLRQLLVPRELEALDVDDDRRIELHAAMLARKPMLAEVFAECHHAFMQCDLAYFGDTPGDRIELGAGVAPVRDTYPDVLATDVVAAPGLDRVLDALDLDLGDGTARALYGQNCFHHFPDPARFLTEAERVIAPGGGVILIEPFHGAFASLLYKRLFASEDFDKGMPGWTSAASGPMTGANQALSYIVFERDREQFGRRFPNLELVAAEPLENYVRYLLSGGLNFRQLAPNGAIGALKRLERALHPARRALALHQIIVLRRR